ncbi:hypothetical protein [Marinactinospora rubrisoli]|uniref:Uncharacterized protein n=1 Tax=Marinactinospora rubrisoli TaxID=2715399 RepID=A0ABW2KIB5_9ACTN
MASDTRTLPPGRAASYTFTITGPDGRPVTDFAVSMTKRLHFYAIRSDLTGFQHVHGHMTPDGTWTVPLAALTPESWRVFAQFTPGNGLGKGQDFVLSRPLTVPGTATTSPLPAPSSSVTVDGYTLLFEGDLEHGLESPLTVTVGRNGEPVTDLQPYLDAYAHLTAFHEGDPAFAHLHPLTEVAGGRGGPVLRFMAEFPKSRKPAAVPAVQDRWDAPHRHHRPARLT